MPDIWEVSKFAPLFAWGRSGGLDEKSGWSFAQRNFQTGYSRVLSSTGGDSLNEGIFHTDTGAFTIQTVQYRIKLNDSTFLNVPSDSMMGVNWSVFGRIQESPSSVDEAPIGSHSISVAVRTNRHDLQVQFKLGAVQPYSIEIYDVLGRLISELALDQRSGSGMERFNTQGWTSGKYFVRLSSANGESVTTSFQITR